MMNRLSAVLWVCVGIVFGLGTSDIGLAHQNFMSSGYLFDLDEPRPPQIHIEPYRYDSDQDLYVIPFLLNDTAGTDLIVALISVEQSFVGEVRLDPRRESALVLAGADLETGRDYLIEFRAVNHQGVYWLGERGDLALATMVLRPMAAEPCGLFCRGSSFLRARPWVLISVVCLLAGLGGWLWWWRPNRVKPLAMVAPGHTMVAYRPAVGQRPAENGVDELERTLKQAQAPAIQLSILCAVAEQVTPVVVQSYPFVLGRAAECDYQFIEDRTVSRHHLRLDWSENRVWVTQLSQGVTVANGQRLAEGQRFALPGRVRLQVGREAEIEFLIR